MPLNPTGRERGKTTKTAVMTSVQLTNRGCTVHEEKAKVEKWMQWIQLQFHEEGDGTLGHLGVRGFDGGALPILDHEKAERQGDKEREETVRVFLRSIYSEENGRCSCLTYNVYCVLH